MTAPLPIRENIIPINRPEDVPFAVRELESRIRVLKQLLLDAISRIETLEGGGP